MSSAVLNPDCKKHKYFKGQRSKVIAISHTTITNILGAHTTPAVLNFLSKEAHNQCSKYCLYLH